MRGKGRSFLFMKLSIPLEIANHVFTEGKEEGIFFGRWRFREGEKRKRKRVSSLLPRSRGGGEKRESSFAAAAWSLFRFRPEGRESRGRKEPSLFKPRFSPSIGEDCIYRFRETGKKGERKGHLLNSAQEEKEREQATEGEIKKSSLLPLLTIWGGRLSGDSRKREGEESRFERGKGREVYRPLTPTICFGARRGGRKWCKRGGGL